MFNILSILAFRFPGDQDKRSVHFQAKLPTFKSFTPVGEWLEGKMKVRILSIHLLSLALGFLRVVLYAVKGFLSGWV